MRQARGFALVALALAVTVCCCASVASAQAPAPSADRLFCKRLDAERDVRFAWSFNDTHVLVSVSALTDGAKHKGGCLSLGCLRYGSHLGCSRVFFFLVVARACCFFFFPRVQRVVGKVSAVNGVRRKGQHS